MSFEVHEGEVLAIAGVQGNGQTELTEAIMGLQPQVTGNITLDGKSLRARACAQVLDAGVGFVPEDRHGRRPDRPSSPSPRTSCSTAPTKPRSSSSARCS